MVWKRSDLWNGPLQILVRLPGEGESVTRARNCEREVRQKFARWWRDDQPK